MRVGGASQATAFHNPLRCRLLMACSRREASLAQLSKALGIPLPKLHYHVGRLLDAGLLEVSRTEARAGRPIRYYRAIAEQFLVPQSLLPASPSEAWAEGVRQSIRDENSRNPEVSLLYASDPEGRFYVRRIQTDPTVVPRTFARWYKLNLNVRQRGALAQELSDLLERYARVAPEKGAEPYWVHGALAPRREND